MNSSGFVAILSCGQRPIPERLRRFGEQLLASHGFASLVCGDQMIVAADPAGSCVLLPESRGLIWGHLFDRAHAQRMTQSSATEIANCDAEQLLERYWGGYVAIRACARDVEVIRDPSGTVACYHCEIDGAHIITSQPHLLFEHRLLAPSIDWTIVAQSLVYRDLRPARTALRGVSEILPGVVLTIGDGRAVPRVGWSPWSFARRENQILDPARSATALCEAAMASLNAWSTCFGHPLLEVSGGLDSAIVATGFHQSGKQLHSVTFGPAPGDPSELPWARALASHLGMSLVELVPSAADVDFTTSDAGHLPRPCARTFAQAMDRPLQSLALEMGADAFVGGGGGDSMFCFQHSALPVIDRLRDEGFGMGIFQTAGDMAELARTNAWKVLLSAVRRSMLADSRLPRPHTNQFVDRSVCEGLAWPSGHPWLEAPPGISPGKKRHIWSIISMQNHIEGFGREAIAPYLAPLMSQPIFETCMAIPSWHWCMGGNNRAVAREAFRGLLPKAITDRRTKVSFNGLVQRLTGARWHELHRIIRTGGLAREKLLDTARLDQVFQDGARDDRALSDLMALVAVEAWIRAWERPSPRLD